MKIQVFAFLIALLAGFDALPSLAAPSYRGRHSCPAHYAALDQYSNRAADFLNEQLAKNSELGLLNKAWLIETRLSATVARRQSLSRLLAKAADAKDEAQVVRLAQSIRELEAGYQTLFEQQLLVEAWILKSRLDQVADPRVLRSQKFRVEREMMEAMMCQSLRALKQSQSAQLRLACPTLARAREILNPLETLLSKAWENVPSNATPVKVKIQGWDAELPPVLYRHVTRDGGSAEYTAALVEHIRTHGTLPASDGKLYFTANKIDSLVSEALQIPHRGEVRVEIDTNSLAGANFAIPPRDWAQNTFITEPLTRSLPEHGEGGASQLLYRDPTATVQIKVLRVVDTSTGEVLYPK